MAKELFAEAGFTEGHEQLLKEVATILGHKMAELNVAHATGAIDGRERIEAFESQKKALIDELKAMAA